MRLHGFRISRVANIESEELEVRFKCLLNHQLRKARVLQTRARRIETFAS